MKYDKKAVDGKIRFVVPTSIGQVKIIDNIPDQTLIKAMEENNDRESYQ